MNKKALTKNQILGMAIVVVLLIIYGIINIIMGKRIIISIGAIAVLGSVLIYWINRYKVLR